jgi:hypothetical protein
MRSQEGLTKTGIATAATATAIIHRRVVIRGSRMAASWEVSSLDQPFQVPPSFRA